MNSLDEKFDKELEIRFSEAIDKILAAEGANFSNADRVTPEAKRKLSGILKHYAKMEHPFAACVTGDTPIDVPRDFDAHPEGIPISDLRAGDLVYSFNEAERKFQLKTVKWVEITRRNSELVQVVLDTGKVIRCTPDHLFLNRAGKWVEAQKLRSGDSLMPLYRDFEPRIRLRPDRPGHKAEHDIVAEALHGDIAGKHIHHVDRRRANLSADNIQALTGSEHAGAHHQEWEEAAALRDEEWLCPDCEELYTPTHYNQKRCTACQLLRGYQKKIVGKKSSCAVCKSDYDVRSPNQRYCSKICRHRAKDLGISLEGKVGGQPNLQTWNHKVVFVIHDSVTEDVWDMEVEDNHNFVSHGVVLHNCVRDNRKRFGPRAEAVCAVLKDIIRGTTKWRGHNNPNDKGTAGLSSYQPVNDDLLLDEETASLVDRLSEQDLWDLLGLASLSGETP